MESKTDQVSSDFMWINIVIVNALDFCLYKHPSSNFPVSSSLQDGRAMVAVPWGGECGWGDVLVLFLPKEVDVCWCLNWEINLKFTAMPQGERIRF